MNVGFIGLGKLGLPMAVAFSMKGHHVRGYDINPDRMQKQWFKELEQGWGDKDFPSLLRDSSVQFTTLADTVMNSDIIFIAPNTPSGYFEGRERFPVHRSDYNLEALTFAYGEVCTQIGDKHNKIVVIVSTVLPGTIDRLFKPRAKFHLAHCPMFCAMGTVLKDFFNPEFVLIGSDDTFTTNKMAQFWSSIVENNPTFLSTTFASAEVIKTCYNSFLSMKIVFANTVMEICHKTPGANCDTVSDALSMATKRLIAPTYLRGGMGDGGGCLVPGQKVFTAHGLLPIEKIVVGDFVLTHTGLFQPVTKTFVRDFKGYISKITPYGSTTHPLLLTPEHPVLSGKRIGGTSYRWGRVSKYRGHEPFCWTAASSVSHGDVVALPLLKPLLCRQDLFVESEDSMYFLGLYLAEGNTWYDDRYKGNGEYARIEFNLNQKETYFQDEIIRIGRDTFGVTFRKHNVKRSKGAYVKGSSRELANSLDSTFGKYSHSKHIPYSWLGLEESFLISLLKGLFDGDATINDLKNDFYYDPTSEDLATFVRLSFLRLGITHTYHERDPWVGKDGSKHRRSFIVRSSDPKVITLFSGQPVKKNYNRVISIESDYMVSMVRSVDKTLYEGRVFNLEVDVDNSFVMQGGVVHNCHPKELSALSYLAQKLPLSFDFFETELKAREKQTEWLASIIVEQKKKSGLPIYLLGMAFKPETNIVDGSPALLLANILKEWGHDCYQMDPKINQEMIPLTPHVFFVATKHGYFTNLSFAPGSIVIDPFRYMPPCPLSVDGWEVIHIGIGPDLTNP